MALAYKFVQTDEDIYGAFKQLLKAPLIAADTETTGLDPHNDRLLLLQLGDGQMNYVIDCTADNAISRKDTTHPVWLMAVDLFTNSATKIFHNAVFDLKFIYGHFGVWIKGVFCTMLAERVLTAGKSIKKMASLKEIVPKYTNLTPQDMKKEIRAGFYAGYVLDGFSEDQIEYSARDIDVLIPIYWAQITQLMEEGLIETASLEFSVIPVTASMEYVGVNFDIDTWGRAIQELDVERLQKRREVESVFKTSGLEKQNSLFPEFCTISIDSPSQLLSALKKLGVPLEDSTNSGILARMKNDYPILIPLLKYREHQKLITAFGDALLAKINPKTGRLHGSFMQIGADTGRFSARNPNLQQIPSDTKCGLRDCFIAPPGFVALGADYSQQELRVLATISKEHNMLAAYQRDEDLHTLTTAFLFKRDLEELKKLLNSREAKQAAGDFDSITEAENEAKRQRGIAKSINFLIAYGGTYKRLAYTAQISEEFAQEVMDNHGNAFPKLKHFIKVEGDRTLARMYSETVMGRKRYYTLPEQSDPDYERIKASIKRQGVNHIIQGTSADITKRALVYIHHRFTERFGSENAYIWGVIHDEIQTMVKARIGGRSRSYTHTEYGRCLLRFHPERGVPDQS